MKKAAHLLEVAIIVLFAQATAADSYNPQLFDIGYNPYYPPNASEQYAVWWDRGRDEDTNRYIYVYDFNYRTTRPIAQLYTWPMENPHIDGGVVVWWDYSGPEMQAMSIYAYDLKSDAKYNVAPLSNNFSGNPNVSGDYIVWWDTAEDANSYIYAYKLSTRSLSVLGRLWNTAKPNPNLSGYYVVWSDYSLEGGERILAYDLSLEQQFTIAALNSSQWDNPEIDGDHVVWSDLGGGVDANSYIFEYDLSTGDVSKIARLTSIPMQSPRVRGDYVTWADSGAWGSYIYGYEFSSGSQFIVSRLSTLPMYNLNMSDEYIVWSGQLEPMAMEWHVIGYDLARRVQFTIAELRDQVEHSVSIGGDYVLWVAYDPCDWTIHAYGARIYRVPNDTCGDAIELADDVAYAGNTEGATGTLTSSCAFNDTMDVWHSYRPAVGGEVTIDLTADGFDTTLAVFNGCGGQEVACNDDYDFDSTNSRLTIALVNGKRYLIRAAGFDGGNGEYDIVVRRGSCRLPIQSDLNGDCRVDFLDFVTFSSEWLDCNWDPPAACWE